ncbi:hypothetical protein Bbelb_272810 [Branchiostoma belcheri]|nr:hypothetical protein Bbelb_272810 [Branchiostoma belcheri]
MCKGTCVPGSFIVMLIPTLDKGRFLAEFVSAGRRQADRPGDQKTAGSSFLLFGRKIESQRACSTARGRLQKNGFDRPSSVRNGEGVRGNGYTDYTWSLTTPETETAARHRCSWSGRKGTGSPASLGSYSSLRQDLTVLTDSAAAWRYQRSSDLRHFAGVRAGAPNCPVSPRILLGRQRFFLKGPLATFAHVVLGKSAGAAPIHQRITYLAGADATPEGNHNPQPDSGLAIKERPDGRTGSTCYHRCDGAATRRKDAWSPPLSHEILNRQVTKIKVPSEEKRNRIVMTYKRRGSSDLSPCTLRVSGRK